MQLSRVYWTLERWIVPGLRSSQNVYAEVVQGKIGPSTRWLDIGCGHQIFPEWIKNQQQLVNGAAMVTGMDPDFDSIRNHNTIRNKVVGLALPFHDASFTLVTANMVMEHVENPVAVLEDIRRVLTPGGICIFHTTNRRYWKVALAHRIPQGIKNAIVGIYEGRKEEDVYPTHYRINTIADVHAAASAAGFEVRELVMVDTSATGRILLGPFVFVELSLIRLQRRESLKGLRSNIIAVLAPKRMAN